MSEDALKQIAESLGSSDSSCILHKLVMGRYIDIVSIVSFSAQNFDMPNKR